MPTTDEGFIQLGYIREANEGGDQSNEIVIDHNLRYEESGAVNYDTISVRGSLGAIYTYSSSQERRFPIEIEIVDYTGSGDKIETVKRLLRKWREPRVSNTNIVAPPPVLEFFYTGLTTEQDYYGGFLDESPIKCLMLDYRISVDDKVGWNMNKDDMRAINDNKTSGATKSIKATPKIVNISMTLVDIESYKFRNIPTGSF